jgi:hypothetical protein
MHFKYILYFVKCFRRSARSEAPFKLKFFSEFSEDGLALKGMTFAVPGGLNGMIRTPAPADG